MFEEQKETGIVKTRTKIDLLDLMPFLAERDNINAMEVYVEFPIAIYVQRLKPKTGHPTFFKAYETKSDYEFAIENETEDLREELYKIVKFRDDIEWTTDFKIRIYVTKLKDINETKVYKRKNLIKYFDITLYKVEQIDDLGDLEKYVKKPSQNQTYTQVQSQILSQEQQGLNFISSLPVGTLIQIIKSIQDAGLGNLITGNQKPQNKDYDEEIDDVEEDIDESLFAPQGNIQANPQPQNQFNFFDFLAQSTNFIKTLTENAKEGKEKAVAEALEKAKAYYEAQIKNIQSNYEISLKERDAKIQMLEEKNKEKDERIKSLEDKINLLLERSNPNINKKEEKNDINIISSE